MLPLVPEGVTLPAETVRRALLFEEGTRQMSYRFDVVDRYGAVQKDATALVLSASVENNALADIKRTAKFSLIETEDINLTRDFLRPWARLHLADQTIEWPLGVFTLSSPERVLSAGGSVTREVEGFDLLLLLQQDLVVKRFTAKAGAFYTDVIAGLLNGYTAVVTRSTRRLSVAMEWDPGTSTLEILNDLLEAINYKSMTVDAFGAFLAQPYRIPSDVPPEFTYDTGAWSVIEGEPAHELDLYSVPNRWILTQSDPERPPFRSVYTNTNPESPTSTVSRGQIIAEYIEVEAANQATLDSLARRTAFSASQVYEAVEFETAVMPMHADADVYRIDLPELGIEGVFSEHTWGLDLKAGATMSHRARRVVTV